MELAHRISFSRPQERLFSAQIDRNDHFVLRYHALQYQKAQFQSPLRGLRGIRAGLIPHQLHIAKEAGQRIAPRVLLADEVGLGKTIEAGMILQQQLFAEKVRRVLIIVPETLQHQWLVEMLRRFNLHFSLFDEERCADFAAAEEREEVNPFTTESLIICALDWLVQHPQRVQQLLAAEFDMLIADEVHHLVYDEVNPSLEYQLVQQLTQHIPAVLLLTATPEQLGQQSHFARLNLLDPHRFHDYHAFLEEQQHYQPIAEAAQALLADKPLSAVEISIRRITKRSLNNLLIATARGVYYFAILAKAYKVFRNGFIIRSHYRSRNNTKTPLKPSGHLVNILCNAPFTLNISCANSMPIRHGGNLTHECNG